MVAGQKRQRGLTKRLTNTSCLGSYTGPLLSRCSSSSSATSGRLVSATWLWLKGPWRLEDDWWRWKRCFRSLGWLWSKTKNKQPKEDKYELHSTEPNNQSCDVCRLPVCQVIMTQRNIFQNESKFLNVNIFLFQTENWIFKVRTFKGIYTPDNGFL